MVEDGANVRTPDNYDTAATSGLGEADAGNFFAPWFTLDFTTLNPADDKPVSTSRKGETDTSGVPPGAVKSGEAGKTAGAAKVVSGSGGVTATIDFRSYAESIEILNKGEGFSQATVTLRPPLEDGVRLLKNHDTIFLCPGAFMKIQWGYSDYGGETVSSSRIHYYVIQSVPRVEMSGTTLTITVTGVDLWAAYAAQRETLAVWPRRTLDAKDVPNLAKNGVYETDLKILQELASKYKMKVDAKRYVITEQTAAMNLRSSAIAASVLSTQALSDVFAVTVTSIFKDRSKEEAPALEQRDPDWLFFHNICLANNCTYYTQGNTIYIADQSVIRVQKVPYRLVFFTQPETARDIPILDFSTQGLATMFRKCEALAVTQKAADIDRGTTETTEHDVATDKNQASLGARTWAGTKLLTGKIIDLLTDADQIADNAVSAIQAYATPPKKQTNETGTLVSGPRNAHGRNTKVSDLTRRENSVVNMNMSATIPGVPYLAPLMLVDVAGIGIFDGVYLVMEARHTLDSSGYTTNLTLIRESSVPDTAAKKQPKAQSSNTYRKGATGTAPSGEDAVIGGTQFTFDIVEADMTGAKIESAARETMTIDGVAMLGAAQATPSQSTYEEPTAADWTSGAGDDPITFEEGDVDEGGDYTGRLRFTSGF